MRLRFRFAVPLLAAVLLLGCLASPALAVTRTAKFVVDSSRSVPGATEDAAMVRLGWLKAPPAYRTGVSYGGSSWATAKYRSGSIFYVPGFPIQTGLVNAGVYRSGTKVGTVHSMTYAQAESWSSGKRYAALGRRYVQYHVNYYEDGRLKTHKHYTGTYLSSISFF